VASLEKQTVFTITTFSLVLILVGLFSWGQHLASLNDAVLLSKQQALVNKLQLTDLALWTEARYTRHPSQADFFSAFQDSPGVLDHFPAGSLVYPPFRQSDELFEVKN